MQKEGETMMPLAFADPGTELVIKRVGGRPEMKKHLEDLGFVTGGRVTIVSEMAGNLIVNVKETRIAVSKEMAQKILV
jgi:ferrous iron transport protein A